MTGRDLPEVIDQAAFIAECWWPTPGQHVTLIGPNGCGKTTLGMKLLAKANGAYEYTRGVALAMKPDKGPKDGPDGRNKKRTGDETVATLTRQLGGRITRVWPPPPALPWQPRPAFWTYWPTHTKIARVDRETHGQLFTDCLQECYSTGNTWIFADEVYSLSEELKIDDELVTLWTKGRSMGAGMIAATQRPAHVPLWMYSEAKHYFFWRCNFRGAYDRFGEIGTVDKREIIRTLDRLSKHDCLYLYPDEDVWAVIR